MRNIFFTADQHLGHANIIKYTNRPFANVDEMDNTLIDNHNMVVGKNDITYHLGDISFQREFGDMFSKYISRMNGLHVFIKGNHDYWADDSVPQILEIKVNRKKIVLCHYSMCRWNASYHGSWHLFGHSHGLHTGVGKSFDVGVDCNNYTPVSYDQVAEKMKTLPNNQEFINIKTPMEEYNVRTNKIN